MSVHYLTDPQGHTDSVVVPLALWRQILASLENSPESLKLLEEIPDPLSLSQQEIPAKPENPLQALLESDFIGCFEAEPGLSAHYKTEFGKLVEAKYAHR